MHPDHLCGHTKARAKRATGGLGGWPQGKTVRRSRSMVHQEMLLLRSCPRPVGRNRVATLLMHRSVENVNVALVPAWAWNQTPRYLLGQVVVT